MPLGHLATGLLGGVAAALLTMTGGFPTWVVVAQFVAAGNLISAISAMSQLLSDELRGPSGPGRLWSV